MIQMKIRLQNNFNGYAQYINQCMCRLSHQFPNFDTFFRTKYSSKQGHSHLASNCSNLCIIVNAIHFDHTVIGFVLFVKLDELDDMRYQRLSSVIAKMFCGKLISVRLNPAIYGFQSSALPLSHSDTACKSGIFITYSLILYSY